MLDTYLAPAKINLGLEVLYKRPDSYHEINTLFCRVAEPHDVISVTRAGFFRLTCSDETLPTDNRNLIMHTAEEFAKLTGKPLPRLHIHLQKNIPIGAGLGGGSSNAAATLQILRDWHLTEYGNTLEHDDASFLDSESLLKLASKLGADVPFFFSGAKTAQASGIGEKLSPMNVQLGASVLIVFDPQIHISTRDAYASLTPSEEPRALDYTKFFGTPLPINKWKEQLHNDFEPEIFRQFPQLAGMKHSLYAHGASFALMSGSGSSIYGLFENPNAAREAKQFFESQGQLAFLSA
jgi:4-diphosphocytidyl-2-C-methyl-D-erythritol kinase